MPAAGPQATRRKQLKKKRAPSVTASPGDRPSSRVGDAKTNAKAKRTPLYRQASQEAYSAAPTARKRLILKNAKGVEGAEARKVHAKRLARNQMHSGAIHPDRGEADLLAPDPLRDKSILDSRIKYLRRTRKPVTTLKRELEGKGLLAEGLHSLGGLVEERVKHGGAKLPGYVETHHSGAGGPDPTKLGTRLVKDAIELPATVLPALYVPLSAGYEASKGHDQKLKQLGHNIDKSDPIYNAGAAAVDAIAGDTKSAGKRLKTASVAAQEHPGFTLAEAGGVKGLVGRGAGRVARTGVAGKTVKQIASTTREPLALEGTSIKVHREWSPDVIKKAKQVTQERFGPPALRHDSVTAHDIKRRVDERVGVTGLDPHPFVGEFAARSPAGKVRLFTPSQIDAAAKDLHARTGHQFSAQHADQAGNRQVLVPTVALDRLSEHANVGGKTALGKGLKVANDAFRQTVLSTSTSWAAGNVLEASLRTGLVKAGPRSLITGHKVMKRLEAIDPDKAVELAKRVTGGGHYSLGEKRQVQTLAENFAGTHVEPLAKALTKVRATPGPKQVADLWHVWTDSVFGGTRRIESQFQKAMLGAEIRRSPLMDGHLRKLSHEAIDQAARGLRDTNEQVAFARKVQTAYGKYDAFSPSMKQAMSLYSPFVPWFLNAVKFVTHTLPADHPAAVGLAAVADNATEEWRKDHGLSLWMDGSVPGWLQGSVPGKGGKKYRVSRFTPFGAFGDLGGTLSGQVLPLYSGPLLALKGLSWNGQRLDYGTGPEGEKQAHNALVSIGEFIDATIPVVSQAKRVGDKGIEAFNPMAPVEPKKASKRRVRRSARSGVTWSDQPLPKIGGSTTSGPSSGQGFFK